MYHNIFYGLTLLLIWCSFLSKHMQIEQLGFTYFMPMSELCDPSSVQAQVGFCRMVDRWKYDSRWEVDHVCIRNGLDSSYMDSLQLTSCFRSVFLGLQNPVNKFEYNDSLVTNDFIEHFGWGAHQSFLHHDVQGFTRATYEKFEDMAKVTNLV
jgi:hypothetical protein